MDALLRTYMYTTYILLSLPLARCGCGGRSRTEGPARNRLEVFPPGSLILCCVATVEALKPCTHSSVVCSSKNQLYPKPQTTMPGAIARVCLEVVPARPQGSAGPDIFPLTVLKASQVAWNWCSYELKPK